MVITDDVQAIWKRRKAWVECECDARVSSECCNETSRLRTSFFTGSDTCPCRCHKENLFRSTTSLLPILPAPLRLKHGPLLVTLEWWDDDCVVAYLPACAVWGEGSSDNAALKDLGEVLHDWAVSMRGKNESLGGALKYQWSAFLALVDISDLEKWVPPEGRDWEDRYDYPVE